MSNYDRFRTFSVIIVIGKHYKIKLILYQQGKIMISDLDIGSIKKRKNMLQRPQ